MIFPVDGYKCIWSDDVADLWAIFAKYFYYDSREFIKTIKSFDIDKDRIKNFIQNNIENGIFPKSEYSDIIKLFTENGIKKLFKPFIDTYEMSENVPFNIKNNNEIMLLCDKYYIIDLKYKNYVLNKIKTYKNENI